MGLGKTLTMIALILGSYQRAEDYTTQDNGMEGPQQLGREAPLFLKATLIVVPSEREANLRFSVHWQPR